MPLVIFHRSFYLLFICYLGNGISASSEHLPASSVIAAYQYPCLPQGLYGLTMHASRTRAPFFRVCAVSLPSGPSKARLLLAEVTFVTMLVALWVRPGKNPAAHEPNRHHRDDRSPRASYLCRLCKFIWMRPHRTRPNRKFNPSLIGWRPSGSSRDSTTFSPLAFFFLLLLK